MTALRLLFRINWYRNLTSTFWRHPECPNSDPKEACHNTEYTIMLSRSHLYNTYAIDELHQGPPVRFWYRMRFESVCHKNIHRINWNSLTTCSWISRNSLSDVRSISIKYIPRSSTLLFHSRRTDSTRTVLAQISSHYTGLYSHRIHSNVCRYEF